MNALILYWNAVWDGAARDIELAKQTHTAGERAAFHRAMARTTVQIPAPAAIAARRAKSTALPAAE